MPLKNESHSIWADETEDKWYARCDGYLVPFVGMIICVFFYLLAAYIWSGLVSKGDGFLLVKKIIATGIMPVSMMGLSLMLLTLRAWCLRESLKGKLPLTMLCLVYWACSTPFMPYLLLPNASRAYDHIHALDPKMQPFDIVIVLGGGTGTGQHGQAMFGADGDRIGLGARLYHLGKTKKVICTGSTLTGLFHPDDLPPAESAKRILLDLKVPEEALGQLEGRNTREEMVSISRYLQDQDAIAKNMRVGLITTKYHIPRAMRLAEKHELDLIPLPAGHGKSGFHMNWTTLIPQSGTLGGLRRGLTETLAKLAGH